MNAKELCKILDGFEYPFNISKELEKIAMENNLVIVSGASDDLMYFNGVIYDELGSYGNYDVYLNKDGIIKNKCDCNACYYFKTLIKDAKKIKSLWRCENNLGWSYETDIPHEIFNIIKNKNIYCKGIIFSMLDI